MADQEQQQEQRQETQGQQEQQEQLKDKHGEDAINRGRYDRDMQAKADEIAALKEQLRQLSEQAGAGTKAQEEVASLRQQLADEKLDHQLELAGCVNAKAAKALLDDYAGDVAKLAEACPYLFRQQQQGSTGFRPGGAPGADFESKIDRAFGIK